MSGTSRSERQEMIALYWRQNLPLREEFRVLRKDETALSKLILKKQVIVTSIILLWFV